MEDVHFVDSCQVWLKFNGFMHKGHNCIKMQLGLQLFSGVDAYRFFPCIGMKDTDEYPNY